MKQRRNNPLIAVKNRSTLLTDNDVISLIPALQRQVTEHFEPAWGMGAQLVFAKGRVPRHAYQIQVLDEADEEGYIGYHIQDDGYPVASIFAKEDMADDGTISDTMSHEILEMLVDPAVNLYAYRPGRGGRPDRGYFYEVCDPVQCQHYYIDKVKVCNFVYPEWYEYIWPKGSRRFDHLKKISEPFEILPGCYADVREVGKGWRTIWGSTPKKRRARHRSKARKHHE